jgi:GT2 family glycosyltransferase
MVDLSVIVVNYNRRELLRECLRSVRARRSVELIVVDNGSADGSADAVAAEFPAARLLRQERNLGFARAVNLAMGASSGDVLLLLNNDTVVQEGALDVLLDFLEAHPRVGIVGAQLLNEDGTLQHSFDNFPTLGLVLAKGLARWLRPDRYPSRHTALDGPREVESVIGAAMAVRRGLVEQIGPLDEAFFWALEETDWCRRAWAAGWKVMIVPEARVRHRSGATKALSPARAEVEYVRSLFAYFRKHAPRSTYTALRLLYVPKTFVNLAAALAAALPTLFLHPGARRRAGKYAYLLGWQLVGCPASMGLPR